MASDTATQGTINSPRAVIIGGSIAGLSTGIALKSRGWDVVVLERSPGSLEDRGAGLGISPDVIGAIGALGGDPESKLVVHRTGKRRVTFVKDGKEVGVENEVGGGIHGSWAGLWRFLKSQFTGTYRAMAEVDSVHVGGHRAASARLYDGSIEDGDLVVFADGYNSQFRSKIDSQSSNEAQYAGYILWRGVLTRDTLDKHNLADKFPTDTFQLATQETHHCVVYPIPDDLVEGAYTPESTRLNFGWYMPATLEQVRNWFRRENGPADPRSISADALLRQVAEMVSSLASQTWPSPFSDLFRIAAEERSLFAAGIFEHAPTRMAKFPFAIVGDAAHTASPITGAGARHAILDALALGEALEGRGVKEGLEIFEKRRLPVVRELVASGHEWGTRFRR